MEEPETKEIPAQVVISVEHTGPYAEIGPVYHRLYEWARKRKVQLKGPGFTIFHSPPSEFDTETALFEVCLPVESPPGPQQEIMVKELPASTVAWVRVKGPYSQIPAHYTEFLAWLEVEGWTVAGPPREVYIVHPDARGRGDENEFVTEIQFPIKE
jgi:effector-binding domain-containing protein